MHIKFFIVSRWNLSWWAIVVIYHCK